MIIKTISDNYQTNYDTHYNKDWSLYEEESNHLNADSFNVDKQDDLTDLFPGGMDVSLDLY